MVANCGEVRVVLANGALIAHAFTHITTDLQVEGKRNVRVVGELARVVDSLATSKGEEIDVLCEYSTVAGEIVEGFSIDSFTMRKFFFKGFVP